MKITASLSQSFHMVVLLLVFSCSMRTASARLYDDAEQKATTVFYHPVTINGHDYKVPVVQVKINDKLVATLIVDTGSNISILSNQAAEELKLDSQPAIQNGKPYLVEGKPVNSVAATVLFGQFILKNIPFIVFPKERLQSILRTPVDGLIGNNVLKFYALKFNFSDQEISMYYPGNLSAKFLLSQGFSEANCLALKDNDNRFLYFIPIKFHENSREVEEDLMIDTGGVSTRISQDTAKKLKLQSQGMTTETQDFSGSNILESSSIEKLSVGNLTLNKQKIYFPSGKNKATVNILGMDVLSQLTMLIDYPRQKVYFNSMDKTQVGRARGSESK